MDQSNTLERAIDRAVARLLRPLFRVLLRHGKSYTAFEDIAKRAFVDVAMDDFGIPGKKPTVSRASVLSGLSRKEVQRLLQLPALEASDGADHQNRATRVLTAWVRDAAFHDAQGNPRPLPVEGDTSFAALVKRYSGDMPTRAVLDELLRVGAVARQDDGQIALLARGYVPRQGAKEMVGMLGTDVADLIETIDHNLHRPEQAPRFQRKVMYRSIPLHALPAFQALSAKQGQALLEQLDQWLHDAKQEAAQDAEDAPRARVGLGIYYFEDTQPARSSGQGVAA